MKKVLFLLMLIPILSFAQTHKQRKAQGKADAITTANITAHIQYLTGNQTELAVKYIVNQFQKDGLAASGTNGYIQEFAIDEGKQFDSTKCSLIIDDQALALGADYYPLAFSANSFVKGLASPGLREKGSIWFWDVKDVLDDNKQDTHFDISNAILQQSKEAAANGGKALIIYNSTSTIDNIQFIKHDTSAQLAIPVIYIKQNALKKYLEDATAFYNISLQVKLLPKSSEASNIIGLINNNAKNTVIIGADYAYNEKGYDNTEFEDNASGAAALIELGRILKNDWAKNNNYLLIAFPGKEHGLLGSKYWLEHPSPAASLNYMLSMDMLGKYDSTNKLNIGGYTTSPVWKDIFKTTTDENLVVHFDSSVSGPSEGQSFYLKNIPSLSFYANSYTNNTNTNTDGQRLNYAGEVEIINYIHQIIDDLNDKGKLVSENQR